MPDYNLNGLSSRSFEQLIQALSVKIIGPQVTVFGDGRDGGREATFEGPVDYPTRTSGWNGYGVIQAKFKQRLQDPEKDGIWALSQLRKELEVFADPQKNRRKPQYYILATNVVLTPVQSTGTKDRIDKLFREFEDKFGLLGYDVWDYDKIRVFLDGDESLRNSYAAWITPGDVLAQFIEWFRPQTSNFEDTITLYLQKELLADQYANLEQAGHASKDRIPIAQVFVDLPSFDKYLADPPPEDLNSGRLPPGVISKFLHTATERLDPQSSTRVTHGLSDVDKTSRDRLGRFVLIGGPGQGKTTIGQYICQLFRAAILQERPHQLIDPEAKQVLGDLTRQCEVEGITLPMVRRFPIRIVLSQFAKSLASIEEPHINSLISYLVNLIHKKTDEEILPEDFRRWLSNYPWIIVFDGLDEVPASSNRDAVLDAIRDFRIDARASGADVLIIATSRPQGYNDDFNPNYYEHTYLAPLSVSRAMHYAKRLAEARYGSDEDRKDKVVNRLTRASQNEATARLMRSPLQVTIMATLVDRMGQPPQERWNLFKEYYRVIYQREVEREIPAAVILRNYQPDVDIIHYHTGLLLQVESERSGKTDARLSRKAFEAVVENRLLEEGHEGKDYEDLKTKIIEAAMDRLVFLVGLQADEVGFEIRSLQEFMAAESLMDAGDEVIRKRLRAIGPISNWRNVFLFAAGKCFVERQHLRDTIYSICAELNEDPDDGPLRETLAGSRLALDLLDDGPARRQPKYAQGLARLSLRLLDLPPDEYQLRLSDLFEIPLETVYTQEIDRRLSSKDPVRTLGAWNCLVPLVEKQSRWAHSLAEERWPAGAPEQLQVILNTQHSAGQWSASKFISTISQLSPLDLPQKIGPRLIAAINSMSERGWFTILQHLLWSDEEDEHERSGHLRLKEGPPRIFSLGFIGLKDYWHLQTVPLDKIPTSKPEWRALYCAIRFLLTPSTATHISALKTIINCQQPAYVKWLSSRVSWPLAACLTAADVFRPEQVVQLAESGAFGDEQLWHAAETRWFHHGFNLEDVLYKAENFPLDRNIALQGMPNDVTIAAVLTQDLSIYLETLFEVYQQVKGTPMGAEVAHWTLFCMGCVAHAGATLMKLPTFPELKDLIQSQTLTRKLLSLDFLGLYNYEENSNEDWIAVLDWLGRQDYDFQRPDGKLPTLETAISKAFLIDPTRFGLLRILLEAGSMNEPSAISSALVDLAAIDEPRLKLAAITIRSAQGRLKASEVILLAREVADLLNENTEDEIMNLVLELESQNDAEPYIEFLLELKSKIPTRYYKLHGQIGRNLNDSLTRRTSRLSESDIWENLSLPLGLMKAISIENASA